jgi:hypothetical protein
MRAAGLVCFAALLVAASCGGDTDHPSVDAAQDEDAGTSSGGDATTPPSEASAPAPDAPAPGSDAHAPAPDAPVTASGGNSVPIVIDRGPTGNADDVAFITITVCVPGTTTCQNIDHIMVDTGSAGLRLIASTLSSDLALPEQKAHTGDSLAECTVFADGYSWGSIRLADLRIAGELAANIPVEVVGDPAFPSVPSDCSSTGPAEDAVSTFGANGLLGLNQLVADCGTYCASGPQSAGYYSCTGSTCTGVTVPVAQQVSNPIASFASDKNGALIQLAAVPASGATTATGSLVFGIGTAANNGLGSATVLTIDVLGNFTTHYKSSAFTESFVDSGTSFLGFNDTTIPGCSGPAAGFYCPSSPLSLTAENVGRNGKTTTVSFEVESADTLFGNAASTAFDDIAGPGIAPASFDWGLPFFFGRTVYFALEGASTPGGNGPYVAY